MIFISEIDLNGGGSECVTVGEDGRINLVNVGESRLDYKSVFDNHGLVSYTAVKWWNQRKFGVVSQLKGDWAHGSASGIVLAIDIHPSRKHVWEVQYDSYVQSRNASNTSSTQVLPVMMCSEDGILASSIEQGGNQVEVLQQVLLFGNTNMMMMKHRSRTWAWDKFLPSTYNTTMTHIAGWDDQGSWKYIWD
ncbi:hypothetical protein MKW92_017047, partial [Papaver armeniacum]